MIKIRNLSKNFSDKTVLKNADFDISENEVTCIMGESGIGKTTLLRIIGGLEKQDSGSVEGVPDKKGFMFQEDRLIDDISPVSNIRIINRDMPPEEIVKRLIEAGINEKMTTHVSTLSGGMARRVALLRTLCSDSEILLLDEPFKGLDVKNIERCCECVRKYRENRTLIAVVHSKFEAECLGGSVIDLGVISDGR